jgi:hypothetical protein
MRAAASIAPARVRNWQSQRVTRRSLGALELAGSVFHPVPSQRGQTSAAVLINLNPSSSMLMNSIFPKFYYLTLRRDHGIRKRETPNACVQAVNRRSGLWRSAENTP